MSFNLAKIREIEGKTKDILADFYTGKEMLPPIDIGKIVEKYGLIVKKGQFKSQAVSGAFDRKSNSIFVSENDPYTRQAFTVAHELGHYILHKEKTKEIFYRKDAIFLEAKPEIETEADCFAANILMPKELVERFWPALKNVDQMATLFKVSFSAINWRLKNLGLID